VEACGAARCGVCSTGGVCSCVAVGGQRARHAHNTQHTHQAVMLESVLQATSTAGCCCCSMSAACACRAWQQRRCCYCCRHAAPAAAVAAAKASSSGCFRCPRCAILPPLAPLIPPVATMVDGQQCGCLRSRSSSLPCRFIPPCRLHATATGHITRNEQLVTAYISVPSTGGAELTLTAVVTCVTLATADGAQAFITLAVQHECLLLSDSKGLNLCLGPAHHVHSLCVGVVFGVCVAPPPHPPHTPH
jgi:hypothetical protein